MRLLAALLAAACCAAQESPVPTTESPLSGSMELGYRWRTDVAGNFDAYRSVVDLGSGPKLLNTDFSLIGTRFFDRIDVQAQNWQRSGRLRRLSHHP